MKSFSDLIFEEKFSNFNDLELKAFADQLEEMKKNVSFLQKIVAERSKNKSGHWKTHRRGMTWIPASDAWAKLHTVPKSDKIVYGNKYIVVFDNPFTNTNQLVKKYYKNDEKPEACSPDEDNIIIAIAIADKFGKLHLVNQWEKDCTIQYRDKGLFLKKENSDDGVNHTFYSDKGWYLYRKGFASYYVKQTDNYLYIPYPDKQENTFVRLETCVILDMSTLPAQFEKMQAEIEKRAKEDAEREERYKKEAEERKKQEEERLRKEEENRKWWKEREGYTHCGCANGWKDTPELVQKAYDDKDAKWYSVEIGRCYHQYFCDKYKVTYTVDSSD